MKHLLTIITLLFFTAINAQITFEAGYYINNANQRVEGFIKNLDWKNNPTSFLFKSSLSNEETKTLTINEVKEFSIINASKYERHKVKIDRSSDNLNELEYTREPNFKDETLFLKVLVENNVSLYRYTDSNITKFFYKSGDNIHSLIYKRYYNINKKLDENNFYKQQIASGLNCSNTKMPSVENLRYSETSLVKYFNAYGVCTGSQTNITLVKKIENSFNVKVIAGIQSTSFSVDSNTRRTADFGSTVGFVPGIELEYVLPFNAQKWSVFVDARYQSFSSEISNGISPSVLNPNATGIDEASYKALDFSLGIRHYFLINSTSKIYLGLNYSIDFINDTEVIYDDAGDLIASSSTGVLGIGAGYTYDKLSAEIRYHTNRNSLGNEFILHNSDYSNVTFSLSYRLVKF